MTFLEILDAGRTGPARPARFAGPAAEKRAFVADVFRRTHDRLGLFASLPIAAPARLSLRTEIDRLGPGAAQTSAES